MSGGKLVDDVNLARIRWCCEEVWMTREALADAVGVDAEKLERGGLTHRELNDIGEYFGYTGAFYCKPGLPDREAIYTSAYRSILSRGFSTSLEFKRLFDKVEGDLEVYLILLKRMDRMHHARLPSMSGEAVDVARQTRAWLDMHDDGRYGFEDYRRLLEAKGVLVFMASRRLERWKVRGDCGRLAGLAIGRKSQPTIFINEFTPQRRTFALFHALGRLLMHRGSFVFRKSDLRANFHLDEEIEEANDFAEHFLLPEELLDHDAVGDASPLRYDEAFKAWEQKTGVDTDAVVSRLLKKGMISKENYDEYQNSLRDQPSSKDAVNEESALPMHLESERVHGETYVRVVLEALRERQVTLYKACKYLDINLDEVKKLQARYEIWGSGS